MTPSQGRELGQGIGTLAGAAASRIMLQSNNPFVSALGVAVSGYSGRQIGGAIGEAAAANRGHCKRTTDVDVMQGGATTDTAKCQQQTPIPGNSPQMEY